MSDHPPAKSAPARSSRQGNGSDLIWRSGNSRERHAITLGIVGTLLFHLILILLVPRLPWDILSPKNQYTAEHPPTFDIELTPDISVPTPAEPEPPALPRFVEVNPNAPDNPPDKTDNVGAQNQQAAQEIPTPGGNSDTPAMDGESPDATAIVSGQLTPPTPPSAPPTPPAQAQEPETSPPPADTAQLELKPLPGYENLQGTTDNAPGTTNTPLPAAPGADARQADGTPTGVDNNTPNRELRPPTFRIDRTKPMARPRLPASVAVPTTRARSSPILKNELGTQNIGVAAYDARWSSYGEYLQRLIDTVDVQWHRLILNSAVYPASGTRVVVKFVLNAKGEVAEIVDVTSNGSRPSEYNCVNAIQARAPYGEWTEDMISVLGQSQELTFTFHYQ